MVFGWSAPKLMVILAVAFLLFGVPLLAWIVVRYERWKEELRE